MISLEGIIPPLITPFDRKEAVDVNGLRELVDYVVDGGVHGVICCASVGEDMGFTLEEHNLVAETVVEEVNGKIPVLVGIHKPRNRDAVEFAKHAKDIGAYGVMPMAPAYCTGTPTEEGFYEYYETIAEEADIPVMIYNYPERGYGMQVETIVKLAELENIVALKNSDYNLSNLSRIIGGCGQRLNAFTGWNQLLIPALSIGAKGCTGTAANVAPKAMVQLYDAFKKENMELATRLHYGLLPLWKYIFPGAVMVKEWLNLLGIPAGKPRKPLSPIDGKTRQELRSIFEELRKREVL